VSSVYWRLLAISCVNGTPYVNGIPYVYGTPYIKGIPYVNGIPLTVSHMTSYTSDTGTVVDHIFYTLLTLLQILDVKLIFL
jgi:hypothetical protein